MNIYDIIQRAENLESSDIHIVYGLPPRVRIDGRLIDLNDEILTDEDCEYIAKQLLEDQIGTLNESGESDAAITVTLPNGDEVRCRINCYRHQGHISTAIRILRKDIPDLDKLGLPPIVSNFADYPRGIVLVTGETGSGKSTTLASLLQKINVRDEKHIITLEDSIEYIYQPDRCTINQRQIGLDTDSYASGLRSILRQDPDVILIGEMRDRETIDTALTAAETGHLVFATLHTTSAPDAVDRIVNVFPGDRQAEIRLQTSMVLRAVLSQQLLPHASGKGRVLACEVMINTLAMANLIRKGKTHQMHSTMMLDAKEGSVTRDQALVKLVKEGKITGEIAIKASQDTEYVSKNITTRPEPNTQKRKGVR